MQTALNLSELAKKLSDPRLPKQKEIAKAIGADQGFVSHVRNGHVKRVTNRIILLSQYVNIQLDPRRPIDAAVCQYLSGGGDPALLVKQVVLLAAAQGIDPNSLNQ